MNSRWSYFTAFCLITLVSLSVFMCAHLSLFESMGHHHGGAMNHAQTTSDQHLEHANSLIQAIAPSFLMLTVLLFVAFIIFQTLSYLLLAISCAWYLCNDSPPSYLSPQRYLFSPRSPPVY